MQSGFTAAPGGTKSNGERERKGAVISAESNVHGTRNAIIISVK